MELMIVMLVITAMAGLTYGYIDYARHRARLSGTEALVQGVTTAVVNHQAKSWSYEDGGQKRVAPIWDVNRDGILDGNPESENAANPGTFSAGIIGSGYTGFLEIAKPTIPRRNIDSRDRVVDAWQQPLRIAYARRIYGANGFGVWSVGPDGIDGNNDDIRSWEMVSE